MRKVSKKLAGDLRIYKRLRRDFLLENYICAVQVDGCSVEVTQIHHKRGRGKYLNEVSTFVGCCFTCHRWIEEHPVEAKEKGFSESRLNKKI